MNNTTNKTIVQKTIKSFLLFVMILSGIYSCKEKEIVLIENRTSDYKIVIEKNAGKEELFAAKELQNYLEKIATA